MSEKFINLKDIYILSKKIKNYDLSINKIKLELDKTKFAPSSEYFYLKLLEYKDKSIEEKLADNLFLERCYACLIAWKLNRGQNWLIRFSEFEKLILKEKETLLFLNEFNLESIDLNDENVVNKLKSLFCNLKLVTSLKNNNRDNTESVFVSVSKLLHFILPHLVIPMDNAYTTKIVSFYGSCGKQFDSFMKVLKFGQLLLRENQIKSKMDYFLKSIKFDKTNSNQTYPKLVDNIIINLKEIN